MSNAAFDNLLEACQEALGDIEELLAYGPTERLIGRLGETAEILSAAIASAEQELEEVEA